MPDQSRGDEIGLVDAPSAAARKDVAIEELVGLKDAQHLCLSPGLRIEADDDGRPARPGSRIGGGAVIGDVAGLVSVSKRIKLIKP